MDLEDINYRTLRHIQQKEQNTPILTKIDKEFYQLLAQHIDKLEERLEHEKKPQKQALLKDEIHNTKKLGVSIYEQREKKIVLAAISKARGGHPDVNALVEKEQELYDALLSLMSTTREQLLQNESTTKKPKQQEPVKPPTPSAEEPDQKSNTRPIIQITKDIPEFVGTDEKRYHLKHSDVLSLPEDMSSTLVERGVAKKIKK